MSEQSLDPAEFAERLDAAFGAEPGHAGIDADLARGRRRLRRHRAGTSLAALAAVSAVAGVASVLPTSGTGASAGPASTATPSTQDVVAPLHAGRERARARRGQQAALRLDEDHGGAAADDLRSDRDPRRGDAAVAGRHPLGGVPVGQLPGRRRQEHPGDLPDRPSRSPSVVVDGVDAYAPRSESDPRLAATQTPPVPQFEVTCNVEQPEETAAWYREAAACPTYTLTWNDRRPAVVGHVGLTAPDGKELDADVRDGFVSLAYTGHDDARGSPPWSRAGRSPQAKRVTFYTAAGELLVDDRDPGHLPAGRQPLDRELPVAGLVAHRRPRMRERPGVRACAPRPTGNDGA